MCLKLVPKIRHVVLPTDYGILKVRLPKCYPLGYVPGNFKLGFSEVCAQPDIGDKQ